ncbi:hypothetical protein L195_g061121, partial [Trifolium pratense]
MCGVPWNLRQTKVLILFLCFRNVGITFSKQRRQILHERVANLWPP